MKSNFFYLKNKALKLRKFGKTYGEIKRILDVNIPKSTLSYWFKNVKLSKSQQQRIKKHIINNIYKGHILALAANKEKRKRYLNSITKRITHLKYLSKNKDIAKIIIAMLYLGEGSKTNRRSIMFGNSDPNIINLFLRLLRYCYNIDENKFRCTIQCRADQNIRELEKFWLKITKIPFSQFYKSRVDPRTIGKKSKKLGYKGVCRIDYFSSDIDIELKIIAKIICEGL